ncbi:unnamed protein product [Trichogramma brassicae]|uniref:Uncharacterized protein n=1 Tax=Trichogramma brassicae TaxID=86971 RepID=A0A6H5ID37_9HYME|nr:unnamed protein product [Trichogramma brassicae]
MRHIASVGAIHRDTLYSLETPAGTRAYYCGNELPLLQTLNIDRRLLIDDPVHIELHGFCDASQLGYGASIYVRSTNRTGQAHQQKWTAGSEKDMLLLHNKIIGQYFNAEFC